MGQPEWISFIYIPNQPGYSAADTTLSGAAGYALEHTFGKNYFITDHPGYKHEELYQF
jgi:hypothetical protein